MATSAVSGHGTLFQMDDGLGVFTTIAEVTSLGGPSLSLETIDVTSHDSASAFREFIGGLKDGGEVSFDINYLPTDGTHDATTGLLDLLENATVRGFKMIFPDGASTTWTFDALVTAFEPAEPIDAQLSASITVKITGVPTIV